MILLGEPNNSQLKESTPSPRKRSPGHKKGPLMLNLVIALVSLIAPKLIGGRDAPTPMEGAGIESLADCVQAGNMSVRRLGGDLLIEGKPEYIQTEEI